MTHEQKIEKYLLKYGADAPLPPLHLLDELISDEFDQMYEKFTQEHPDSILKFLPFFNEENPLNASHPLFREISPTQEEEE